MLEYCWLKPERSMPVIVGTRYIPETHTGTNEEIVDGLIREAKAIAEGGTMRMHAQQRELNRIQAALEARGVDMLWGDGPDDGQIIIVREHLPGCRVDETNRCDCPAAERFTNPIG